MQIEDELNLSKLSTINAPCDSNKVAVAIDFNIKMMLKDSLGNEKILVNNDDLSGKEDTITNLPVSKGGVGINSLVGQANKVLAVNPSSNGYIFVTPGGGEVSVSPTFRIVQCLQKPIQADMRTLL
jgi:hypothetical protein